MIIDKETNKVYFSRELMKKYPEESTGIEKVIKSHNIDYAFLEGTKDIWCRDFMPVQVNRNKFIAFDYNPEYLIGYDDLKSDPLEVCRINNIDVIKSKLNIDGGNIVKCSDKVILTDRIFT